MFGYVKIQKSELRVWEYETYRAVYCSLCKRLGKSYGPLARLTLSYDFTFLAVLSLSLKDGAVKVTRKRCAFNPLKKCNYCCEVDDEFENAAAAAMVMLYYKLLDNIDDSRGAKRFLYKLMLPFFRKKHKKAIEVYPHYGEIIGNYIKRQSELEKANCCNLDEIAEPTSDALGQIFALCSEDEKQKRVLMRLGYCMGKWIYVLDCANDLDDDIKHGSFNPLKQEFEAQNIKAENGVLPLDFAKQKTEPLLNTCAENAALALELLDIKKYKGILDNVIYLGLKSEQNAVLIKKEKQTDERPL